MLRPRPLRRLLAAAVAATSLAAVVGAPALANGQGYSQRFFTRAS